MCGSMAVTGSSRRSARTRAVPMHDTATADLRPTFRAALEAGSCAVRRWTHEAGDRSQRRNEALRMASTRSARNASRSFGSTSNRPPTMTNALAFSDPIGSTINAPTSGYHLARWSS